MNYKKHYNKLIQRAKERILEDYVEKHHVIPRCLGGSDRESNVVILTPEEHYVAHQLLVKMHPENEKLVYALNMMTAKSESQIRRNNKRYGWVKRKWVKVCKQRTGSRNGSYGKYWYYNPQSGENIKVLPKHKPKGWVKGRVINTKNRKCKKCKKSFSQRNCKYCLKCRKIVYSENLLGNKRGKKPIDKTVIQSLLKRNANGEKIKDLAKEIGCSERTLYYRISKYKETVAESGYAHHCK